MSGIPALVRDAVLLRDGHRCARCGRSVVDYPSSVQHRVPRRMGGTKRPESNSLANLVLMCGTGTTGCHGTVESFRAKAYLDGWLVRDYADLEATALITTSGTRIFLTADGDRIGRPAA